MQVDILHPLASLKQWTECKKLPVGMESAQAVWLGDSLYVGGGYSVSESERYDARLYIFTPASDTWSKLDTPVYKFALITYRSQLVMVGGREYIGEWELGPVTNKLWTLTGHDQWRETFPPMPTKRYSASAVEFAHNLFVAGGADFNGRIIDIVEVQSGHHWAEVQCLPKPSYDMKSTVLNGHWYLIGGVRQGEEVYYASLDLLAANQIPLPSVWKRLPDVPYDHSNAVVIGNRLITVGGRYLSKSLSIHAYSPHTQSWLLVGNMPVELGSTCTTVLPTGELMVIGGSSDTSMEESCVYKTSLNGKLNTFVYQGIYVLVII